MHAIKHARETKVPFLGICLGFQLAAVEWAREVLGIEGRFYIPSFVAYNSRIIRVSSRIACVVVLSCALMLTHTDYLLSFFLRCHVRGIRG